ncbi:MAG: hypothetical protein KDE55_12965 [Novosphingobium sp.]|nr:hypothetical protein [Novosphingobium sp.]
MRIVFSRKGFDSTAGGAPSPIIDGRPVSLPIPSKRRSDPTFASLGHGKAVRQATRGKLTGSDRCHDDPMFADGHCWFGQCGAAQGHLRKHGVREGDAFLFFGLFADPDTGERHHRLFGHMRVACFGSPDEVRRSPHWREPPRAHPHLSGEWDSNNTLWFGPAATARTVPPSLRLTRPGGPLNLWTVPSWLRELGLSYHGKPERWIGDGLLDSAKRGQEFVCDIGNHAEAAAYLEQLMSDIEAP